MNIRIKFRILSGVVVGAFMLIALGQELRIQRLVDSLAPGAISASTHAGMMGEAHRILLDSYARSLGVVRWCGRHAGGGTASHCDLKGYEQQIEQDWRRFQIQMDSLAGHDARNALNPVNIDAASLAGADFYALSRREFLVALRAGDMAEAERVLDEKMDNALAGFSHVLRDLHFPGQADASVPAMHVMADFWFWLALGTEGVLLLLIITALRLLAQSVIRPIRYAQSVIVQVARQQNFSARMQIRGHDELAALAAHFNHLMSTLQQALSEVNEVVSAFSRGDFDQRVRAVVAGDLEIMKTEVNKSAESGKLTMAALGNVITAMRDGNFSRQTDDRLEGQFRHSLDKAMHSMQDIMSDVGAVMKRVAAGDLASRVHAGGKGDLVILKNNINASLDVLSQSLQTISLNTHKVATASRETSLSIGQISDGARHQMHAVGQVATNIQQTARSITDVSHNTEAASRKSYEAAKSIREGRHKMVQMVEAVNNVAVSNQKINEFTDVIQKIAEKTNLLSLNAVIEAARAGEHGSGFAVVAKEVGKLAATSAQSTKEIAALVHRAVEETQRAVQMVAEVSEDMRRIETDSVDIEAMMQRISAAMGQQNSAIQEINANVTSLNRIAENNASASEEITATVQELARIAENTGREVNKFRL